MPIVPGPCSFSCRSSQLVSSKPQVALIRVGGADQHEARRVPYAFRAEAVLPVKLDETQPRFVACYVRSDARSPIRSVLAPFVAMPIGFLAKHRFNGLNPEPPRSTLFLMILDSWTPRVHVECRVTWCHRLPHPPRSQNALASPSRDLTIAHRPWGSQLTPSRSTVFTPPAALSSKTSTNWSSSRLH